MTNETINLIIEWFGHIQQMTTDRKTQTGAVMDAQHCLNEIASIASDSKQFVEEYRYEQDPIDEDKIDKLVKEHLRKVYKEIRACHDEISTVDIDDAYRAGYYKGWEDRNNEKSIN